MFIEKKNVVNLKGGDKIVYENGAKRRIELQKEFDGIDYDVAEYYDNSVDKLGSSVRMLYSVVDGKVILRKDATGIERDEKNNSNEIMHEEKTRLENGC